LNLRLRRTDDGLLEEWDVETRGTPRAPRYRLQLPLVVRAAGERAWTPGVTANASRTGILFSADAWWPPETAIEVGFDLTPDACAEGPRVMCVGVVVRSTTPPPEGPAAMAARISAYRFVGDAEDGGPATVTVIGSRATS
jgi:hypothetical protein